MQTDAQNPNIPKEQYQYSDSGQKRIVRVSPIIRELIDQPNDNDYKDTFSLSDDSLKWAGKRFTPA